MSVPQAPYVLEESLGHLASRFSKRVLGRIAQALGQGGYPVTSEQWSLLVHVWSERGQTQGQLAKRLLKDKTNLARLAGSLEELGYIRRVQGEADGREKRLFLTERGELAMDGMTAIVGDVLADCLAGVSPADLEACKRVLRAAHGNLKKIQT